MTARAASPERRETSVGDTIRLTIPLDDRFRSVPALVLGGVGSRIDLPYERMDDLQLAVLSTLDAVEGAEAVVELDVDDEVVSVAVGPLRSGSGRQDGLERVLSRLVDRMAPVSRDGVEWMTLQVARGVARDPS